MPSDYIRGDVVGKREGGDCVHGKQVVQCYWLCGRLFGGWRGGGGGGRRVRGWEDVGGDGAEWTVCAEAGSALAALVWGFRAGEGEVR